MIAGGTGAVPSHYFGTRKRSSLHNIGGSELGNAESAPHRSLGQRPRFAVELRASAVMQDRMDRQDHLGGWTDRTNRPSWTAGIFDPAINDVLNVLRIAHSPITNFGLTHHSLKSPARAFRSRCPLHRKRESQRHVSGCETSRSQTALLTAFGSPCHRRPKGSASIAAKPAA